MLKVHYKTNKKHILIIKYQQIINQVSKKIPSYNNLTEKEAKYYSLTCSHIIIKNQKLYYFADQTYLELREVIPETQIYNTIIQNHNFLKNASQDPTSKVINHAYYSITQDKVIFFIYPCEIYHQKTPRKFKKPLKNIISTRIFE